MVTFRSQREWSYFVLGFLQSGDCAPCHSEVTVAGVGSFGVMEGFPDVSFHSSAVCFGSLASLAVFKQFSRAVGALSCTGRPGMWAPEPHFQADDFFSYWSSARGFI